jgi:hypothetical protein
MNSNELWALVLSLYSTKAMQSRLWVLGEILREPIHGRTTGLVRALTSIDRIMATLDLQQTLGLTGASEGGTNGIRRANRIILGKDHEEGSRGDQLDRLRWRVFENCLERTHGDLVTPRWCYCRLRLSAECVAVLIALKCEALPGESGVRDVDFTPL